MNGILLLIGMLFLHIVDDYYLQGVLASMKQKAWWEKNYPNPLYKNDYIMALATHGFSWTVMIHIPIIIYSMVYNVEISSVIFVILFFVNWVVHAMTDHVKANLLKINLIQDQLIHIVQVVGTCVIYANMFR
jgi:flagellar biosynthesis protein FliQ